MRKGLLLLGAFALAAGCGPEDVTAPRLSAAVGSTFGNLYDVQQHLLGQVGADLRSVSASCTKAGYSQVGAGEGWTCTVTYLPVSGRIQSVTYDMSVLANGCFHAQGPPGVTGPQTETAADGRTVTNPLFAFDGCFEPRG